MTDYSQAATLRQLPIGFADGADPDTLIVTIGPLTLSISKRELATILAGWGDNQYLVKAQIALAMAGAFTPSALVTASAAQFGETMSRIVYPQ
jgi:hypothetical protein